MEEPSALLPHVVIFPFPAQGHINPGLQLAQLLASSLSLCRVTFLNTSHNIAKLKATHLHLPPSIRLRALADDGHHGHGPDFFARVELMGGLLESFLLTLLQGRTCEHGSMDELSHRVENLEDGSRGAGDDGDDEWPPPVCIISDMFLGWVQDIADKLNIPRFVLFTPSPATLVLVLLLPEMLRQGRLPCHDALEARMQPLDLPGLTQTLRLSDIPSHLLLSPSAFMFDYFIRHSKRVPDATGILLNSFYQLQSSAIDAAQDLAGPFSTNMWADLLQKHFQHRVIPVGPLLPSYMFDDSRNMKAVAPAASRAEDDACLQWLDSHPPSSVVYVSFGSMAELGAQQIRELAWGLQASGKPFLWVVRGEGAQYLPHDMRLDMERGLEVHEGDLGAQEGSVSRSGTQAAKSLVVSWAPQLDVLLHPSTGFFLSHCGWNSTLEAICAGVPVLGWPLFAEQNMNCRVLVDELHIAMEFSKQEGGLVGKEEVERVVRKAMETEQGHLLRKRASEWKGLASEAVADGGSSHENVKAFGSFLSSLHALSKT